MFCFAVKVRWFEVTKKRKIGKQINSNKDQTSTTDENIRQKSDLFDETRRVTLFQPLHLLRRVAFSATLLHPL